MQYNQLCLGLKTWSPCLGGVVACPALCNINAKKYTFDSKNL